MSYEARPSVILLPFAHRLEHPTASFTTAMPRNTGTTPLKARRKAADISTSDIQQTVEKLNVSRGHHDLDGILKPLEVLTSTRLCTSEKQIRVQNTCPCRKHVHKTVEVFDVPVVHEVIKHVEVPQIQYMDKFVVELTC